MGLCGHDNTQTNCREPRAVQRVRVHRHGTQPNEENHPYTVVSPWYDLARTFYQQDWTVWDGTCVNEGGLLVPLTVTEYRSTLVPFMQQKDSL